MKLVCRHEDTTTPTPDPSTEEYEVNLHDSDKATVLSTLEKLKDGYFYQDGNKIEKNGKFNLPTKDGYKFVVIGVMVVVINGFYQMEHLEVKNNIMLFIIV